MHLVRPLDAQEHSEDSDQNLLEHILENEGGKVGHEEEEAQGEVQASKVALVVVETSLEGVQHDAYANLGVPPGKGWGLEYRTLNPPHWIVQKQYGRDCNKRYQDNAGRNNVWQDVGTLHCLSERLCLNETNILSHLSHRSLRDGWIYMLMQYLHQSRINDTYFTACASGCVREAVGTLGNVYCGFSPLVSQ